MENEKYKDFIRATLGFVMPFIKEAFIAGTYSVETKKDLSPVTEIDRKAEMMIREMIAKNFGNDLFPASCEMLPEVKTIVDTLRADGFPLSAMSGSGSCCFALSTDQKKIKAEEKRFLKLGYEPILTKTHI